MYTTKYQYLFQSKWCPIDITYSYGTNN